ncbi:MAG TPA: hypothetical protein VG826_01145 [Pirellulales bacterium]|nr:hypothetical protein [Pirellulales bacterium]
MRGLLLASIAVLALGAADSAHGGWRTYGARGDWRTYGVANKTSPDGLWWRGYGRMGYGWYSVYGAYIGSGYSTLGFGYPNRPSDPWTIGNRAR